ncbi:fungal specific transcription factor [Zalerion maritima]|uniref:Fungal specific transcription factor n=1 Tax=Zalerion maritima TaxID=339359 RepID=A0AAD5RX38_9PEZI|nr:fungal specific transcription factor [Zalerion maritima]
MSDTGSTGMRPPPVPSRRPPRTAGSTSETHSESESDEDGNHEHGWQGQEAPSPTESMPSSGMANTKGGDGGSEAPTMPTQKRRRVTRACDECRRKKIKCDGKQPCTHCQVYSYECTYDKPSNRRRNPAPQYIEALEDRLTKAENLLRQFIPDLDLTDHTLDPAVQQEFRNRERARAIAAGVKKEDLKAMANQDAQILSMIESLGQLDLDDRGTWDFHGVSSGAVFLKKIQEHFPPGMFPTPAYQRPFLPKAQNHPGILSIESPGSAGNSPWAPSTSGGSSTPNALPPRDTAQRLCDLSLSCATCLIRIVHIPTFYHMIDRLYDIPMETHEVKETRFLGLLYAVMALGCLYDAPHPDVDPTVSATYKTSVEQGVKYYTTARTILQDITECQDLTTLQAIVFSILFLQGTSNLTGCYAFVGIAFRSAITMGLHRHIPHPKMSKIEDQVRRRVFYIIRQMDTYVSAMLGFPMMNIDDAVDQPYPTEVNDEFITDWEILTPPGTPSFFQAFNAHTKLMEILAKIVRFVYPMKGIKDSIMKGGHPNATYMISYRRILEVETELQQWLEKLPDFWKPNNEGDQQVVRVRHLLRFAYAHVQMMLYRPFTHYCSPRVSHGKSIDQRAFHCAASAVNVSRNIIHIGTEIRKQGVLIGPYWFIMYTQLFAILSLVFYVIENPDKAGSDEILADATAGRDMINSISKRSAAAEKVSNLVKVLFEQLPEKLGKAKGRAVPTKKRSAPASKPQGSNKPTPPSRRSSEMARSASGSIPNDRKPPSMSHRASVDSIPSSVGNVPEQMLPPNLQEMVFDGISNGISESATTSPTGSQYQPPSHFTGPHAQQQAHPHPQPTRTANPVYNDMFSPNDPFAYPNQPLLELANQQTRGQPTTMSNMGPQRQDSGVFSIPSNLFDDLDGQLVNIPSYLMEGQEGQNGVEIPSHVFEASGVLGGLGQHAGQGQGPHAPQQQPQQQQHQAQHPQHQQMHHQQGENGLQGLYVDGGSVGGNWNPNFFQNANYRG